MAVRRGLAIDGTPEVEVFDDGARAKVEVSLHQLFELPVGDFPRAVRVHHHRDGLRHADRVRHLELGALGQPGRHDGLRDVTGHVRPGAIDLRRILAGERAAAVRAGSPIGVDDDLASGEPGIAHRAARDEPPGRVDVVDDLGRVEQGRGDDRQDHVLDHVLTNRALTDVVRVLRRDQHVGEPLRDAVLVLDRHLRLAVRTDERQRAVPPDLGQALREAVREPDRHRHEVGGLVAGVAEHQPLVAGAFLVDAERDVARLLVDRGDDTAGVAIEAVLGADVADVLDGLSHHLRDVDVTGGRDLAGHDHEPGREQRLARDAPPRVLRQDRVEHGVRDLVGDLVRVALGHRLGREEKVMPCHR